MLKNIKIFECFFEKPSQMAHLESILSNPGITQINNLSLFWHFTTDFACTVFFRSYFFICTNQWVGNPKFLAAPILDPLIHGGISIDNLHSKFSLVQGRWKPCIRTSEGFSANPTGLTTWMSNWRSLQGPPLVFIFWYDGEDIDIS